MSIGRRRRRSTADGRVVRPAAHPRALVPADTAGGVCAAPRPLGAAHRPLTPGAAGVSAGRATRASAAASMSSPLFDQLSAVARALNGGAWRARPLG
jgi:hypothetical protein